MRKNRLDEKLNSKGESMNNAPFVSIVIPCRNEEKFICRCLDSVIRQDYQKETLEVLIVDGMSGDNTKKIVKSYSDRNLFIKLLDNPKKITPCALNIGIRHAKGEIIVRMDAHATYADDYVSKCVRCLYDHNADNVGGAMITHSRKDSLIDNAMVLALSHKFGVGNSSFRTGTKEPQWVDTVFGGCYKVSVFDKIGLFNEKLSSSQDIEFNARLRRGGGKILLMPDIVSHYYARSGICSFLKNNFRNGVWAVLPIAYSDIFPMSLRHMIPFVFVLSLLVSAVLSFELPFFKYLFFMIVFSYVLVNGLASLQIAISKKKIEYFIIMLFTFAALHVSYGVGSLFGLVKMIMSPLFWVKMSKRTV